MLRRLLLGFVLGLVVGALIAASLVAGLKIEVFEGASGAALAFFAAALGGVVTGLVAGKPIWASNAKIEAGLKAFFGGLLGAGAMFALRQWAGGWSVDLSALHAGGPAPVGTLPGASLPIIAATLGALFELDNTGEKPDKSAGSNRKRISAQPPPRGHVSSHLLDGEEAGGSGAQDAELVAKRAKK